MKFEDIKKKKIGLFVDNGIDRYRRKDDVKISEMIHIYLTNGGFFVLIDDEYKLSGYLDVADLDTIEKIFEDITTNGKKTVNDLIGENKLKFRTEIIDYDTPLIDVLTKLNSSNQIFFPIIKDNILIGRVSKKSLKEKIEDLY